MQSKQPWHIEFTDGNNSLLGPSVIKDVDNYVVAEGLWTADAERILACVNFCAGFSNEDLEGLNGLRLVKAMADSSGEMLLEVQQECGEANSLLENLCWNHSQGVVDPEFDGKVYNYLMEKGIIK